MSADLFAVAGKKIYIGGVLSTKKTDFVEADFASQTWTEIDGWETHGAIGDTAALITTALINRTRDIKQKGTANAGQMQNNFAIIRDDAGQIALRAAGAASNKYNYAFKIEGNDTPAVTTATITATIAAPGVVTDTAHGFSDGDTVKFTTTGALPTGITSGTTYYVINSATNTYQLAATKGGSAITTTGTQSGVHTRTTVPSPTYLYFIGLVMSAVEQGGNANTAQMLNSTTEINSNVVTVLAAD